MKQLCNEPNPDYGKFYRANHIVSITNKFIKKERETIINKKRLMNHTTYLPKWDTSENERSSINNDAR